MKTVELQTLLTEAFKGFKVQVWNDMYDNKIEIGLSCDLDVKPHHIKDGFFDEVGDVYQKLLNVSFFKEKLDSLQSELDKTNEKLSKVTEELNKYKNYVSVHREINK